MNQVQNLKNIWQVPGRSIKSLRLKALIGPKRCVAKTFLLLEVNLKLWNSGEI